MIFPKHEKYSYVNKTCSNLFHKLIEAGNKIASLKAKNKKSSRHNIDWEIDKEARTNKIYDVQGLTECEKRNYFGEKLAENTAKPKKLWQALKSLRLPNK